MRAGAVGCVVSTAIGAARHGGLVTDVVGRGQDVLVAVAVLQAGLRDRRAERDRAVVAEGAARRPRRERRLVPLERLGRDARVAGAVVGERGHGQRRRAVAAVGRCGDAAAGRRVCIGGQREAGAAQALQTGVVLHRRRVAGTAGRRARSRVGRGRAADVLREARHVREGPRARVDAGLGVGRGGGDGEAVRVVGARLEVDGRAVDEDVAAALRQRDEGGRRGLGRVDHDRRAREAARGRRVVEVVARAQDVAVAAAARQRRLGQTRGRGGDPTCRCKRRIVGPGRAAGVVRERRVLPVEADGGEARAAVVGEGTPRDRRRAVGAVGDRGRRAEAAARRGRAVDHDVQGEPGRARAAGVVRRRDRAAAAVARARAARDVRRGIAADMQREACDRREAVGGDAALQIARCGCDREVVGRVGARLDEDGRAAPRVIDVAPERRDAGRCQRRCGRRARVDHHRRARDRLDVTDVVGRRENPAVAAGGERALGDGAAAGDRGGRSVVDEHAGAAVAAERLRLALQRLGREAGAGVGRSREAERDRAVVVVGAGGRDCRACRSGRVVADDEARRA